MVINMLSNNIINFDFSDKMEPEPNYIFQKLSISCVNDIGGGKVQQDRIGMSPDGLSIVLCDGHGLNGHNYAEKVLEFQSKNSNLSPTELFTATTQYISENFKTDTGGTSCTNLKFDPATGKMTVSNIGDSSVRYWDSPGEGIELTTDHTPHNKDEFIRVTTKGGECNFHSQSGYYYKQPVFLPDSDGNLIFNVNGRKYNKSVRGDPGAYFETPSTSYLSKQLGMTRSFGDFELLPYGLSTEPSIKIINPPEVGTTRVVVAASDGLWDAMLDKDISAIIFDPVYYSVRDSAGASKKLLEETIKTSRRLFGSNFDNIAIAVIYY